MKLIFLGTGSAFAKTLYNNNLLVEFAGTNLLIDCGNKAPIAMHELGLTTAEIDNIFITHLHADHIGGLEEVALTTKYLYRKRINLYVKEEMVNELWNHSLKGGLQYTGEISQPQVALDYYFNVFPISGESFKIKNTTFHLFPTRHVQGMKSFGLFFNKVFFSGDSQFDEELINEFIDRSNLFFYDSDFMKNPVHTYYRDMMKIPKEKRYKVFLMHYSDIYKQYENEVEAAGLKLVKQHQIINV